MVTIDRHLIFYPLNLKNIGFAPNISGVYWRYKLNENYPKKIGGIYG